MCSNAYKKQCKTQSNASSPNSTQLIDPGKMWRQQNLDVSCFFACIAMLLASKGVDDKDDLSIINDCKMMYRIVNNDSNGSQFVAGLFVQTPDAINYGINQYGYKYVECTYSNWEDYISKGKELLANHTPFVASVSSSALGINCPESPTDLHAIICYMFENDHMFVLDPAFDNCVILKKSYAEVKDDVSKCYSFHCFMASVTSVHGNTLKLGYLEETVNRPVPDLKPLIECSLVAISQYASSFQQVFDGFVFDRNPINTQKLFAFHKCFIDAFIMPLRSAFAAMQKCHCAFDNSIPDELADLYNTSLNVISYQKKAPIIADYQKLNSKYCVKAMNICLLLADFYKEYL